MHRKKPENNSNQHETRMARAQVTVPPQAHAGCVYGGVFVWGRARRYSNSLHVCMWVCVYMPSPSRPKPGTQKVTKSRAPTNQPRIHHLIITHAQSAPRPSGCITLHTTITRPAARATNQHYATPRIRQGPIDTPTAAPSGRSSGKAPLPGRNRRAPTGWARVGCEWGRARSAAGLRWGWRVSCVG